MTTDDITSMVSTLFNALTGKHGEAARIAAIEAMHKLMADYSLCGTKPLDVVYAVSVSLEAAGKL